MEEPDYWIEFWKNYGKMAIEKDEQTQVLRTLDKKPINKKLWEFTLKDVEKKIEIQDKDILLELCCGNGLISRHLSSLCSQVISVDISEDLIKILKSAKRHNIQAIVSDIRKVEFKQEQFSKVIIYAGIQYLSYAETVDLFERVFKWLKPKGIFFIGDVPDINKLWTFYNNKDRKAVYFKNLRDGMNIVGSWFDHNFLKYLALHVGFSKYRLLTQHPDLIYSKFRYDYKFVK